MERLVICSGKERGVREEYRKKGRKETRGRNSPGSRGDGGREGGGSKIRERGGGRGCFSLE